MKTARFALLLVGLLAAFHGALAEESDMLLARLEPQGMVSDFATVFEPARRASLETLLKELEEKTTAEIAVVTLPSLNGGDIEDFANRLFEKWGIGQKDKDNGVLVLTAVGDREIRIEVGYGLEGILPDARTGRIIDEHIIPSFKNNDYAGGLEKGAQVLAVLIAQDAQAALTNVSMEVAAAEPVPAAAETGSGGGAVGIVVGIILLFLVFMVVAAKKGWIKSSGSGGSSGGSSSGSSGSSGGSSSSSSGGGGFGGGSSGGGGASRSW